MAIDHAELLKLELVSIREKLINMDTFMPQTRAGELAEKINVCLDYLFHLEDMGKQDEN